MRRLAAIVAAIALACVLRGEPPSLDALYPAGAARGTTNVVTAVGKFSTWPVKAWISGEGVTLSVETNKGKLSIAVSPDALPGPRLVRLYNTDGPSDPRFFVVGDGAEMAEVEPNNRFDQPQSVSAVPVTINGRLDKNGDVDSFAVKVPARQYLVADVDAYTMLSKVDAVLRIVTTNGQQLAWNHDFTSLDPRMVWRASRDEEVIVQLFGFAYPPGSEVALTGGEGVVYRMHLGIRNKPPELCPASTEKKSDDKPVNLPASFWGRIEKPDHEDRFSFTVEKDTIVEAKVHAASLGSPLDAWLKIEASGGAELARNDDVEGSPDPRMEWRAPTNGTYVARVGSVTHRGGAEFCYELTLSKAQPDYRAVLSQNSSIVKAGATNELKLDLKRLRGFTNELGVAIDGLPSGVTLLTTNLVATDSGSVTVRLAAVPEVTPFSGSIRVYLVDSSSAMRRAVPFELTTSGETGYSRLLVEKSEELWVTVMPTPPAKTADAAK